MGLNDRHDPGWPPPDELAPPDGAGDPDGVPVSIDLARANLYRLLDELARSSAESHGQLVLEFERAWEAYREETAKLSGLH